MQRVRLPVLIIFIISALVGSSISRRGLSDAPATSPAAISFRLDVMPIFMRAGCNSGSCHGSARGQDGFRLSLFGYDPAGDYFRITRELPTRRVNLALPEESLIVQKSIGAVAHTGGKRFDERSPLYKTLVGWVQAGCPQDPPDVPAPASLQIEPTQVLLEGEGAVQQMRATARYSDGSQRDVTSLALFLSSNDSSAKISPDGMVTAGKRGEAFVMARFATFTVGSQVIVVPKDVAYQWPGIPESNYIDTLVDSKLKKLRILPSAVCDDQTFLRRAFIDIVGQLPTRQDYESFLASSDAQKREKLIDQLLARKEFVELWVMKWAELLQIRTNEPNVSYKAALLYYNWLQDRIAKNVPINQIVKELLSASGGTFKEPATNFYQAETDTLKLTENVAQVFMGIRMQCAQCHNHPFDRWTMDDYYGLVSFFTQVGRKGGEDPRETIIFNGGGGEHNHPLTATPVPPKFPGGAVAEVNGKDRRAMLAEWLAAPDNPYFARNVANIIWAHFLGRGIVEPVDDVRISNPASNPELLDALAAKLVEYNFDFKRLVRDICTSRTYQLCSIPDPTAQDNDRDFSHALVRRLRAEVLLDCVSQVTEAREKFPGLPLGARAVQIADGQTSTYFLSTFGRATRQTVCSCEVKMEPNLGQALNLLNGETVHNKVESGGVVKRLLEAKRTPEQIVEELYIRCFSRPPTAKEVESIRAIVSTPSVDVQAVLVDLFWALLNSKEFMFNH